MAVKIIEVKALAELMKKGETIELIDVRTPAEYETVHAAGAKLVPLDRIEPKQVMAGRTGPVYVICKAGSRSAKACEHIMSQGYDNVISVAGGTDAWVAAGLPVEKSGRNVLPLDRQAQLAAGMVCLTGVILGTFVNPWFYLLCAMVGCGLSIAGLFGFCGMAVLLGKMPWNQGKVQAGARCCAAK